MTHEDAITATRQWFAQNALDCHKEAEAGALRVNDLEAYLAGCLRRHAEYLAGRWDHTLTFRQRAEMLLTGECRPLLP